MHDLSILQMQLHIMFSNQYKQNSILVMILFVIIQGGQRSGLVYSGNIRKKTFLKLVKESQRMSKKVIRGLSENFRES